MTHEQNQVAIWMAGAGQTTPSRPVIPDSYITSLRLNLIREEVSELQLAFFKDNVIDVADALGDILYVVLGTAVACGIDIDPVFQEIHRSNMTKLKDGYKRDDGKWMKGPSYETPNLGPIIDVQTASHGSSQPLVERSKPSAADSGSGS